MGLPIWSGHFYQGRQTFMAYHYLIRKDGSYEQVLKDHEIGWQAGNWEVNCRSIALCFVDNLEQKTPTPEAVQTAKEIISRYPEAQIKGHREINPKTTCPGELFLGPGGWNGWLR